MTVSSTVLGVSAALVFGAGLYLFHEVNATPAHVDAAAIAHDAPKPAAPTPPAADGSSTDAPPPPEHTPGSMRGHHMMGRQRPEPTPAPAPGSADAPPEDPRIPAVEQRAHPAEDAVMDQANKAYDNGDLDDAMATATKVLAKDPSNIRMMRIMVSSACQSGDNATAQKYFAQLPPPDQAQMKTRCARYSMVLQ